MTRRSMLAFAGGAAATLALAASPPRPAHADFRLQTGYGVDILPRSTWAGTDLPFIGTPQGEDVRFLLVHHTAGPSDGDPIQIMRGIYAFHTGPEKGWPDVAYNFFIDPAGRVYEARSGSVNSAVQASATGGNQGFAQLVCLLGDFTSQNPTPAALSSLNATLAWLADRYGLDTSAGATATFTSRGSNRWPSGAEVTASIVSGHRDMSQTACPGDTFYPYLVANVQRDVHTLRGNPASAPEPATVPSSTDAELTPDETSAPATTAAPSEPVAGDETVATEPPPPLRTTTTSAAPPSTTADAEPAASSTTTTIAGSTPAPPDAPVATAPEPSSDRAEVAATESAPGGRSSSNGSALAVGGAAAAVALAAAAYVGIRGRHDDTALPTDDGAEV